MHIEIKTDFINKFNLKLNVNVECIVFILVENSELHAYM